MAAPQDGFRSQLLGILRSAQSEVATASHQAWVSEVLAVLNSATAGQQIQVPQDFAEPQIDSARLLFLACGLEPEGHDIFRLPEQGEEVRLATSVMSEYAAQLAREGTPQSKPSAGEPEDLPADCKDVSISLRSLRSDSLADTLAKTWQEEECRKTQPRPGDRLSAEKMLSLGAAFERQPFGSDTCAIHSLNNLLQPKRSSQEAAAKLQEALQAASKDEQNDEKESWISTTGMVGPFSMATLRAAESESREEEMASRGFVPPRVAQLSLLRADSGLSWKGTEQRTGMFDVEAVKLAARSNGFEVIDIEPKPSWHESEASSYLASAGPSGSQWQRWFRGFLVYERIPGRAMHYYSILYWPSDDAEPTWMILDSLDRGDDSPRNRLLKTEDVIKLHDQNSEFFRSWLLRWYPVVDRHAAIESLQAAVGKGISQAAEDDRPVPLSDVHAETELDVCRWNVQMATQHLLEAPRHVSHELQVLQLVVSEEEARASLEATEWNFAQAVQHQSQRLLQHAKVSSEEQPSLPAASAYAALALTDWDSRRSAELLLLQERAAKLELAVALAAAAAALRETGAVHQALLVLQLIDAINKDNKDHQVDEAFAARLLRHADNEVNNARQIAEILHEFPSVPLAICAEALRRGEGASAACMLLKDFEDQVCSLVSSLVDRVTTSKGKDLGSILTPSECQEIARLALDAAHWNPDLAFTLAEGHTLSLIQVRREIGLLQQPGRSQAVAALQAEETPDSVAMALSSLDAMNELQNLPPAVLLAQLQDCDMNPAAAARQLWSQQTGQNEPNGLEGPQTTTPPAPPAPPPPVPPRAPQMSRLSPRKKGKDRKGKDGKDCVTM